MRVRAQAGDTVDALCWRHLGRTLSVTEAVLGANPGLAAVAVTLPAGHPVDIPDNIMDSRATTRVYRLWD